MRVSRLRKPVSLNITRYVVGGDLCLPEYFPEEYFMRLKELRGRGLGGKVRYQGARWSNNRWLLISLLNLGKKETSGTYNGLAVSFCNRKYYPQTNETKENIILNFREEKSKAQKAHMKNGANI